MFQGMEYVYQVYKDKSFSKAAANLFISQPSLSANVKRVEKKVGFPIFDRSTKPLSLTECGKEYIRCVEEILAVEKGFSQFVYDFDRNFNAWRQQSVFILDFAISHFKLCTTLPKH